MKLRPEIFIAVDTSERGRNREVEWSEWRDSNPRPLVPQTSALTGLRYTPTALLIGAVAAPRNVALQSSALGRRRARLRKDSLRLHNFGQRFAQRCKLVIRDPGTGFSRAGIFLSPGAKLDAARHFGGRCNGRWSDRRWSDRRWSDGRQRLNALLLEQLLDAL